MTLFPSWTLAGWSFLRSFIKPIAKQLSGRRPERTLRGGKEQLLDQCLSSTHLSAGFCAEPYRRTTSSNRLIKTSGQYHYHSHFLAGKTEASMARRHAQGAELEGSGGVGFEPRAALAVLHSNCRLPVMLNARPARGLTFSPAGQRPGRGQALLGAPGLCSCRTGHSWPSPAGRHVWFGCHGDCGKIKSRHTWSPSPKCHLPATSCFLRPGAPHRKLLTWLLKLTVCCPYPAIPLGDRVHSERIPSLLPPRTKPSRHTEVPTQQDRLFWAPSVAGRLIRLPTNTLTG